MINTSFFIDDEQQTEVGIDLIVFEQLLSEYAGSYKQTKMISKMKEIYRDRDLLLDFLERIQVDLEYLVILTYNYNPKVITPQLKKELNVKILEEPKYPYRS